MKAGAQVMFIKNDPSPEKRYYNGKIGIVTGLDDGSVEVLPHGAAEPIAVEPAEWLNTKYKIDPETKEADRRGRRPLRSVSAESGMGYYDP